MNTKINEFEVMAPVGSRESLAAAIQAGADSVYFGIGKLNMRSHSANHFTIDDLRDARALRTFHIAHLPRKILSCYISFCFSGYIAC